MVKKARGGMVNKNMEEKKMMRGGMVKKARGGMVKKMRGGMIKKKK
tara:strand:+ start:1104 stop:1241 length:138 start_codon:yes stop_codon:yes gene_type:complete